MDNRLLKAYYDSLQIKASVCLFPGMECTEKPIKAHSIQNSIVFDLMQENDHLIGLKVKPNKFHLPTVSFVPIGRNNASTFEGLCEKHDNELFYKIDDFNFNPLDQQQLFLLAYRSVLKEVHASMSKAIKLQTSYLKKKEIKSISKNASSSEGMSAVQSLIDSYDTFTYKTELDIALTNQDYDFLTHRIFKLATNKPTVVCSQLFSNDSVRYKDSVSRIIMNIFPVDNHTTFAIFSSTIQEKELVDDYLIKCLNSTSYTLNYEISKLIIRNSENFYISPKYFESWTESKKGKIIRYLIDTLLMDIDRDDVEYYLF